MRRCISRLVIVPKLAPGQSKSDPNHGFRVCVNALVNKFLKPCASTIPLAADEITKLFNCKYFLQLDGMNAYWSIPVCEESKRLTAFHTPDGVYCWNRLLMGAKPSSAVPHGPFCAATVRKQAYKSKPLKSNSASRKSPSTITPYRNMG